MTLSPITTAPRFGHSIPVREPAFGAAATSPQDGVAFTGDSTEKNVAKTATAEQRGTLAGIFGDSIPEKRAYSVDTVANQELLTPEGAILVTMAVIRAARPHIGDPARGTVYVLADYPNDEMVELARTTVDKYNRLVKPKGLLDKGKAAIFKAMVGVPLKPVEFVVNPDNPLQGAFKVPVPEISGAKIDKLLGLMEKLPPEIMGMLT